MKAHALAVTAGVLALVVGACGGHVLDVGSREGSTLDTVALGGISTTFSSLVCPGAPPALGTVCSDEGAECEYGTRASAACNQVVACTGGLWSAPRGLGPCFEPLGRTCPATVKTFAQCPPDVGLVCIAPAPANPGDGDRVCLCNAASGVAQWECLTTNGDPDCPWPRPHLGASCPNVGIVCGAFECWEGAANAQYEGLRLRCNGRYWARQEHTCP